MNLSNKIPCTHCNLEFDESYLIKDNNHYFCCKGCQGIFHLLSDSGFDSFYDKVGDKTLAPTTVNYEDSKNYNIPSFYDKFVKQRKDGFNEVSLIIEGIHCSACIWLNEKVLQKMDGVVEVTINFTNNKATIIWVDSIVKLSEIIDMIRAIGYNAFAYDSNTQEVYANAKRREYYLRLAVALFATMNIMMIAVAQYAGYFTGMTQSMKNILNSYQSDFDYGIGRDAGYVYGPMMPRSIYAGVKFKM